MALCIRCDERVGLKGLQTVAELEAEITQIEQLTQRLAKRHSVLRMRINSLAPISRIPPEVLIEIFHFACSPSPAAGTTPLFLGSICAAWRCLAWNTPLLWTRITLRVSKSHQATLHLLPEWLARTTTLPLHIDLSTAEEDDSTFRSLRSILEVLVERSECWGSFECLFPPQCHDILFFHRFPLLTRVVFRPPKGSISAFNELPAVFGGGNAPSLCDVDVSGYDFSSMFLPWDQLRSFKTRFLTVTECYELLKRCPQLQTCILGDVYCPDPHHTAPLRMQVEKEQLVHHNLEVLDVTFIKGAATSLLDALCLPSLKELGVHYAGAELVPLLPVVSLALRSAQTRGLRKLSTTRSVLGEEDMVRCLQALPGLEELNLRIRQTVLPGLFDIPVQGMTQSFIHQFLPSVHADGDVPSVLLPHLKKLHFAGTLGCSVGTVLEMLAWRCARKLGDATGVARLEAARFVLMGSSSVPPLPADMVALGQLREAGLDVEIVLEA